MPTFATPRPITAVIDLLVGDVRIVAGERTDTVVEVHPRDRSNELDVKAAEQTRAEYAAGQLTVKTPRSLQVFFSRKVATVDVTVALPSGSDVRAQTSMGDLTCEGQVGKCSLKTSTGDISVHLAATVSLSTPQGRVSVDQVIGDATVTGSGDLRVGAVGGAATIRNLDGDSWIGEVNGDIRLNSAHGNIAVDRAGAGVVGRTAFGDIRIGDVRCGSVELHTASGEVEVGIRHGTAAWLDVKSSFGNVRNNIDAADGPGDSGETVEIRARTAYGDIVIRRAAT